MKCDVDTIKSAAGSRWPEILSQLGGINASILDGRHHPCPKCQGTDRFRFFADGTGGAFCNQCHRENCGDGFATLGWLIGDDFPGVVARVAEYLGIGHANGNGQSNGNGKASLLETVCRMKRMPIESAKAYGAHEANRGKLSVVRFPIYNELGEQHSHFDLLPNNSKGLFPKGKGNSGLFFLTLDAKSILPGTGEMWIICEGVKDASAYHSLGFKCCGLPGHNLAIKYARLFRGCHVTIMPDRTQSAEAKAQQSAARLYGVAASVRIGTLPLEIDGERGDDARDVLRLPDGEQLLRQAVSDAVEWKPAIPVEGLPSIAQVEGRTEAMNARRFAARFGDTLHWCDPWEKWCVWDGRRWAIDDQCRVESMAKTIAHELWQDLAKTLPTADDDTIRAMITFCKSSNSANGIRNMVALTRSEPSMPILPDQLDTDPWLLNVLNGTIDLRTGKLQPHDRSQYITKLCRVTYDPAAECPTWHRFLCDITGNNSNLAGYLRRLLGYCLTGSTQEHILPLLYGTGANGKSTLVNLVLALLGGDYAMKAPAELLLTRKHEAHPTERADLCGKRFVACIESDNGRRIAESLVKELSGGDRIRARRMFEDFWEFVATHKIWLATNHKPIIRGTDLGIWRRIKLIPFTVTFADDEQDKALPEKLLAELPGILNWSLLGCNEWLADGLGEPDEIKMATSDYRIEMDLIGQFIDECCVKSSECRTSSDDLHKAYNAWGGEMLKTTFGKALRERGYQDDRITAGPQKGRKCWLGVGLLASVDAE